MRVLLNMLRVIFMLSTIVAVTDCCSSRILLLREHTLKIVYQHRSRQYNSAYLQQQALLDKLPQHADHRTPPDMAYDKSRTSDNGPSGENSTIDIAAHAGMLDRSSAGFTASAGDGFNASDSTQHERDAASSKIYDIIELYYTTERDALNEKCSGLFFTDFCINDGRCFQYPVANGTIFYCKCADGYMGERCEYKNFNGSYKATSANDKKKPEIRTARFVFSFPMLIAISVIYLIFGAIIIFKCPQHKQRTAGMFEG